MVQNANNMSHRLTPSETPMDLLADMIATTRTGGVISACSWQVAPWGLRFPANEQHGFHVVLQNTCWMRLVGEDEALELHPGDIVLVSAAHELMSHPDARILDHDIQDPRCQGTTRQPEATGLMCGAYAFDTECRHPVFSYLPSVIHVPSDARDPAIDALITLFEIETSRDKPGAFTVMTRLVDAMLVYIVRHFIENNCTRGAGLLGALRQPVLANALDLIHKRFEASWTIAGLAKEAGTSRATLARYFQDHLGVSPIEYLTECRLQEARKLLSTTDEGLAEIASRVGYADAFSLSKAFKRMYGISPSHHRAHLKVSAPA